MEDKQWVKKGKKNYQISIFGDHIDFSRDEGSAESYGYTSMTVNKFLVDSEWKSYVKHRFGQDILQEVIAAATAVVK